MEFGPVAPHLALGAILAHSIAVRGGKLKKGLRIGAVEVSALVAAGIASVTVARLGAGDVAEDDAAARLAAAIVRDPAAAGLTRGTAFTGRVNLNAATAGVAVVNAAAVVALNRVDPGITLATLSPYTRVAPGALVGTVKIISYAVPGAALALAETAARDAVRVAPVVLKTAGLLLTTVPGQPARLNVKARDVLGQRLAHLGMTFAEVREVAHEPEVMAQVLLRIAGDVVLILTGSATSDLNDTAPDALRRAGGQVERFGMPVDPGNLLFLGTLAGRAVVGLPGCARSPALNGADWVLERLSCGIAVTSDDIAGMGVGGLLKEIPTRPQPREPRHADRD